MRHNFSRISNGNASSISLDCLCLSVASKNVLAHVKTTQITLSSCSAALKKQVVRSSVISVNPLKYQDLTRDNVMGLQSIEHNIWNSDLCKINTRLN